MSNTNETSSTTTDASDDEPKRGRRGPRKCDQIRIAAPQSFTPDEVAVLNALLEIVARGGDARVVARTQAPVLSRLRRKAVSMTRAITRRTEQRAAILAG